jgi:hypothetical protein
MYWPGVAPDAAKCLAVIAADAACPIHRSLGMKGRTNDVDLDKPPIR